MSTKHKDEILESLLQICRSRLQLPSSSGSLPHICLTLDVFWRVDSSDGLPLPVKEIIATPRNLTLMIEEKVHSRVSLHVLASSISTDRHILVREIFLKRQDTHQAVTYGIIQVHLDRLPADMREAVEQERLPFGRALEDFKITRKVVIDNLWKVAIPSDFFDDATPGCRSTNVDTYGRTVLIVSSDKILAEVVEIINPTVFDSKPPTDFNFCPSAACANT